MEFHLFAYYNRTTETSWFDSTNSLSLLSGKVPKEKWTKMKHVTYIGKARSIRTFSLPYLLIGKEDAYYGKRERYKNEVQPIPINPAFHTHCYGNDI